jgi:hypothetical protein
MQIFDASPNIQHGIQKSDQQVFVGFRAKNPLEPEVGQKINVHSQVIDDSLLWFGCCRRSLPPWKGCGKACFVLFCVCHIFDFDGAKIQNIFENNSKNITFFSTAFSRRRSRSIAYNGMAAWRSGGIFALLFKSALPAAVAPNRSLAAGILSRWVTFYFRFTHFEYFPTTKFFRLLFRVTEFVVCLGVAPTIVINCI